MSLIRSAPGYRASGSDVNSGYDTDHYCAPNLERERLVLVILLKM